MSYQIQLPKTTKIVHDFSGAVSEYVSHLRAVAISSGTLHEGNYLYSDARQALCNMADNLPQERLDEV